MFSKRLLIDSLKELRGQVLLGSVDSPECGICLNWSQILNNDVTYVLVNVLSGGWEHRTWSFRYPVPDDESLGLWEGVNLEMRLSLIDHILKRLEESDQDYLDDLCKGY
ncbi:MAG: hypothetical protein RR959_08545 [Erysipelotrichaceae bacterium]